LKPSRSDFTRGERSSGGGGAGAGGLPPRRRTYYRAPQPASTAVPVGEVVEGTVARYDRAKGFGFVELADGAGSAFLHVTTLEASGARTPAAGMRFRGRVGEGAKGLQVTEVVELLDDPEAMAAHREAQQQREQRGGVADDRRGSDDRRPRRGGAAADRAGPAKLEGTPMLGRVRWFNTEKGFGFIAPDDGGGDVFLHASVLERIGLQPPADGQRVMILVTEGSRGREAASIAPVAAD
jgi:CspA family cold shock protein